MTDPHASIEQLRGLLQAGADAQHAAFHREYHKSELRFYGLRTPQLQAIWRDIWPARSKLTRDEVLPLIDPLWDSGWFEEATTAIYLLGRIATQLGPADLPMLYAQTRRCAGWGPLDSLAINCLGPLALARGDAIYASVMAWLDDEWLWARRAAILIHIVPARRNALAPDYAWPSLTARMHEKDFFIRKAIGWTLREISKHYPAEVAAFARENRERMAALSFREGTRNLPPELRVLAEDP